MYKSHLKTTRKSRCLKCSVLSATASPRNSWLARLRACLAEVGARWFNRRSSFVTTNQSSSEQPPRANWNTMNNWASWSRGDHSPTSGRRPRRREAAPGTSHEQSTPGAAWRNTGRMGTDRWWPCVNNIFLSFSRPPPATPFTYWAISTSDLISAKVFCLSPFARATPSIGTTWNNGVASHAT